MDSLHGLTPLVSHILRTAMRLASSSVPSRLQHNLGIWRSASKLPITGPHGRGETCVKDARCANERKPSIVPRVLLEHLIDTEEDATQANYTGAIREIRGLNERGARRVGCRGKHDKFPSGSVFPKPDLSTTTACVHSSFRSTSPKPWLMCSGVPPHGMDAPGVGPLAATLPTDHTSQGSNRQGHSLMKRASAHATQDGDRRTGGRVAKRRIWWHPDLWLTRHDLLPLTLRNASGPCLTPCPGRSTPPTTPPIPAEGELKWETTPGPGPGCRSLLPPQTPMLGPGPRWERTAHRCARAGGNTRLCPETPRCPPLAASKTPMLLPRHPPGAPRAPDRAAWPRSMRRI